MAKRAKVDISVPLLLPSIRSVGTLRYISIDAPHRPGAMLIVYTKGMKQVKPERLVRHGRLAGSFHHGASHSPHWCCHTRDFLRVQRSPSEIHEGWGSGYCSTVQSERLRLFVSLVVRIVSDCTMRLISFCIA